MARRIEKLTTDEQAMLERIADGTLHIDCPTRPRAVSALLDLGLIECDGEHFVATPRAVPYLAADGRSR